MTPEDLELIRSKDLPLERLAALSFMFNFNDQNVLSLGQQKLCVMLGGGEGHFNSDWSQGYSLDTVGVTQILNMHVKDGRSLEMSLSISVAPGRLSQYTKIVRLSPRFIMVNKLPDAIPKAPSVSLWQDSSLLHNDFSSTVTGRWTAGEGDGKLRQYAGGMRTNKSPMDVLFGKDIKKEVLGNLKDEKREIKEKKLFGDLMSVGSENKGKRGSKK